MSTRYARSFEKPSLKFYLCEVALDDHPRHMTR
jgi:hypothetical protein